jgi:ferredoxin
MKAMVNPMVCEGHGRCAKIAPDVFMYFREERQGLVVVDEIPSESEAAVRRAATSCPSGAIIIAE